MAKLAAYERYMKYLCEALAYQDRHVGFSDYSRGLMLPIERKSVEPLAAHIDPLHVSAKHQSLHHLVADSEWSDVAVLARVRDWVMAQLGRKSKFYSMLTPPLEAGTTKWGFQKGQASPLAKGGVKSPPAEWLRLIDRGRHRFSEERDPLGGSSAAVLRAVGQAGQLSGGGEPVFGQRAWQCADRLAAVLAGAMGQGSATVEKKLSVPRRLQR